MALTALGLPGEPAHGPKLPTLRLLLLYVTTLAAPGLRPASGLGGHGGRRFVRPLPFPVWLAVLCWAREWPSGNPIQ